MSDAIRLSSNEQKLNFLLSVIPFLNEHQHVTIRDVATEFHVDLNDAIMLINRIPMFGFPSDVGMMTDDASTVFDTAQATELEADSYIGLWSPSDSVTLRPKLSGGQAAAFLMGLQQLQHVSEDKTMSDAIQVLSEKIASGSSKTTLTNTPIIVHEPDISGFKELREALEQERTVTFGYTDAANTQTERTVTPVLLRNVLNDWLLIGYDENRQADRVFRLDRMRNITAQGRTPVAHELLEAIRQNRAYSSGNFFQEHDTAITVTLEVEPESASLLHGYNAKRISRTNRYEIQVGHFHGLKRLVAASGGAVTVMGPPEAARAVTEWVDDALKNYPS